MKKILLPLSLVVLVLLWAAIPQLPTGLGTLSSPQANAPLLPSTHYNYASQLLPAHISPDGFFSYNPPDNSMTDAGATLGRVLFYDTRLSVNNTISCGSCHLPQFGFSDTATLSKGFDGALGERQSMGLTNAFSQPMQRFFWSATEDTLREQIKAAITSGVEMGLTLDTLEQRLRQTPFYAGLFQDAFGSTQITAQKAASAIGQFVRSMTSKNAKFDMGFVQMPVAFGDTFFIAAIYDSLPNFTPKENDGLRIFNQKGCVNCHFSPNFVQFEPFNNGLDATNNKDKGMGEGTPDPWDDGLFKAPSLRNIELTAPYMHDGRFATLEEVIEHYNSGIQPNPNLSPLLEDPNGQPLNMGLSTYEKEALVAFLHTLTDTFFTTDPRWQDPFAISQVDSVPETPMDALLKNSILGLALPVLRDPFSVFPNPFTDRLDLLFINDNLENAEIRMMDMKGQLVHQAQVMDSTYTIERGGLPVGHYILQLKLGDKVRTTRVRAQ